MAAGCGALPLRLIAGWWKGSAQMVQPMVFGVGGYDVCADP
ncbi:MAG TPA: hypothetical protein VGG06_21235 [Thermoanaerobaculia bacterium]